MSLVDIREIPYKQKKRLVSDICFMYKRIKKTKNYFTLNGWEVNDVVKNKNIFDGRNISFFEVILKMLPANNQEIITKDFLEPDDHLRNWHQNFYSKTTYYKLKHEAIDKFLLLFFA